MKTASLTLVLFLGLVGAINAGALTIKYPTLTQVMHEAEQIGIVTIARANHQPAALSHCPSEYTARWIDSLTSETGFVRFNAISSYTVGKHYLVFLRSPHLARTLRRASPYAYPLYEFQTSESQLATCPDQAWSQQPVLAPIGIDYPATRASMPVWISEPSLTVARELSDWYDPDPSQPRQRPFYERTRIKWRTFCTDVVKRVATSQSTTYSVAGVAQRFCGGS
ncbi:MAG: hypothetical protein GKR90_10305 [Pseudomonadales bacterium]|nr:hypothetical protein [Pseudomonadales bacterium]